MTGQSSRQRCGQEEVERDGAQGRGTGRNGNAESVKPAESPGEQGNGYAAAGSGEITARVGRAAQRFVAPSITYL